MGIAREIGLVLLGLVIGIMADWLLKERLIRSLHRLGFLRRLHVSAPDSIVGLPLGRMGTNVLLLEGNGFIEIAPDDIVITVEDRFVALPSSLTLRAAEIGKEQEKRRAAGQDYAWDGEIAHVARFSRFNRGESDEAPKVSIAVQKAKFYEYLATIAATQDSRGPSETDSVGLRSAEPDPVPASLKPPNNQVNGLPLNFFVLTADRKMIFARRSNSLPVAPGLIAPTLNEHLSLSNDRRPKSKTIDVNAFVQRALLEELGWEGELVFGDRGNLDDVADAHILSFFSPSLAATYGIGGYVRVPLLFSQVAALRLASARDRAETETLIPIEIDLNSVTAFIHAEGLYNSVGVVACLVLLHHQAASWSDRTIKWKTVSERFAALQRDKVVAGPAHGDVELQPAKKYRQP